MVEAGGITNGEIRMVTVTLDEITLNAVKAALDERIARLESEVMHYRHLIERAAAFRLDPTENQQRALVWNIAALHETKLAREYLGDPEVLVDHPADATPESELRYAWGDR